jgi:hypothetical protein
MSYAEPPLQLSAVANDLSAVNASAVDVEAPVNSIELFKSMTPPLDLASGVFPLLFVRVIARASGGRPEQSIPFCVAESDRG